MSFPWETLEKLDRHSLNICQEARARLRPFLEVENLGKGLSQALSVPVDLVFRRVFRPRRESNLCKVGLVVAGTRLAVGVEPAALSATVGRILRRADAPMAPGPLEPALAGALLALIIEGARRSGARIPLQAEPAPRPAGEIVGIELVLLVNHTPYRCEVHVALDALAPVRQPRLTHIPGLPIRLPLVIAIAPMAPSALASLRTADCWLPGAGCQVDTGLAGKALLVAPMAERGISVQLMPDGQLMLGDGEAVPQDAEDMEISEVALEAPIVVRVEVGAVQMLAREWAELQPGDVVQTRNRIAGPAVLRVAGREVARGELVNVDGQVGVRIRELIR